MSVAPITAGKEILYQPKMDTSMRLDRIKTLPDEDAIKHLTQLSEMIKYLARTVYNKKPELEDKPELEKFMLTLSGSLEAIVLKHKINTSLTVNKELMIRCQINAEESGYPTFIKDFRFLDKDKKEAKTELSQIPSDERLVEDALFSMARGVYPTDLVLAKMKKNYYTALSQLDFQNGLKIDPFIFIKDTQDSKLCMKYVCRFDERNDMPRFYMIYFAVPSKSFQKNQWKLDIDATIADSFRILSAFELPNLAKKIDEIEGVELRRLDRYDIGPFYNSYTKNAANIQEIFNFANPTDSILLMNQYTVQRIGESERKGIREKFRAMLSGEENDGIFSPVIAGPTFAILPHRLIQKIQNRGLQIGDNVNMYGITNTGGIID